MDIEFYDTKTHDYYYEKKNTLYINESVFWPSEIKNITFKTTKSIKWPKKSELINWYKKNNKKTNIHLIGRKISKNAYKVRSGKWGKMHIISK